MREDLLKDRARGMRREPTEAERRMWRLLRDRRLGGFKFRRQERLGRYIVDFVCFEHGLIVEIDGGHMRRILTTPNAMRGYRRAASPCCVSGTAKC